MAKTNVKKKIQFWGTGRRKKAIARVRLIPAGSGSIVINDRTFEDYFPQGTLQYIVKQPLALLEAESKYDVIVNVIGGGYTGQAGAIRLGIARALLEAEENSRPALKKAGFLTRDPRAKERNTVLKKPVALLSSPRDNLFSVTLSAVRLCFTSAGNVAASAFT